VSGAAMLFGTMALLLVLSVFNGLEGLVKSLYAVFYPDIAITAVAGKTFEITPALQDKLKSISYVAAYSFTLEENALLEYSDRQHICTVKGVDKNYFNVVNKFDTFIVEGKKILQQDSINYGIVGVGVAQKLGMDPSRAFNPIAFIFLKKRVPRFLRWKMRLTKATSRHREHLLFPMNLISATPLFH